MTHTIADAEAAIARHPESLEELSKAADLLIEQGDPRGEDFSPCLAGGLTAEELMRRHPADVSAMFVAAWRLAGEGDECSECHDETGEWTGFVRPTPNYGSSWVPCLACRGSKLGAAAAARADALRLLAECGKVGCHPSLGYRTLPRLRDPASVPGDWIEETLIARTRPPCQYETVRLRSGLLDAYAAADPDTRRRWAEETRALTGGAGV